MRRLIALLTAATLLLLAPAADAVPDPLLRGTHLCAKVYVNKAGARLQQFRAVGGSCAKARAAVARISRSGVVDAKPLVCTTYRRYAKGATFRCGLNYLTVQFYRAGPRATQKARWDA